ncbi:hypothetical protein [Colwellia sp. PAMC 21821]|uniref:hypothetical protein n=1 Tax=Colwellia sp. PAMC 21821 TaxID=1816219 RepID=UPI00336A0344
MPLNPLASIYAAVTRRTFDDKNPVRWVPQVKTSVECRKIIPLINAHAGFKKTS